MSNKPWFRGEWLQNSALARPLAQFFECAFEVFQLLSGLAELSLGGQTLVVGQVLGRLLDQTFSIRLACLSCGGRRRRR